MLNGFLDSFRILFFLRIISRLCFIAFFLSLQHTSMASIDPVSGPVWRQEVNEKYLRWNFSVKKDQLTVTKDESIVLMETFDLSLFEYITAQLQAEVMNPKYVAQIKFSKELYPEKPAQIQIYLKTSNVELFKFYKENEKKLVLDFWINQDIAENSNSDKSSTKDSDLVQNSKNSIAAISNIPPVQSAQSFSQNNVENNNTSTTDQLKISMSAQASPPAVVSKDLDFRYGASFIWPYPAMVPSIEQDLNIDAKIPENFYPVKDWWHVDKSHPGNARDALVQLIINFYRKQKFGFMKKSMDLFKEKYQPNDQEKITFLYLEANTLLYSYVQNKNPGLLQMGLNKLLNLIRITDDYDLQKVSYRFVLQNNLNRKDFSTLLKNAKDFFIRSNDHQDKEMIYLSSRLILLSLAEQDQNDKLEKFLQDPQIEKWMDTQEGIAFKYYALMNRQDYAAILSHFEQHKSGMMKPIHASILYNVAESYFQTGEIEKAKNYFQDFVNQYEFTSEASFAKLRIALSSELLDEKLSVVASLYQKIVDQATVPVARYEAKLRLVASGFVRKGSVTDGDKMLLGFLDAKADEEKWIADDVKYLLWLVRLRTYIKQQQYQEAITYYTSLPLEILPKTYQQVFEKDGTEIVLGLMQQAIHQVNDGKVMKLWGLYNEKMGKNLQKNKLALFYAGSSALRLGLKKNAEKFFAAYKTDALDEYPQWVPRDYSDLDIAALEIKNSISEKNWTEAERKLATLPDDASVKVWSKVMLMSAKGEYKKMQLYIEKNITDPVVMKKINNENLLDILEQYMLSLQKNETGDRFEIRLEAIMPVLANDKISSSFRNVRERALFLLLNSYFSDKTTKQNKIDEYWNQFISIYPNSQYLAGLNYRKANYLIMNNNGAQGKELLEQLIKQPSTPEHIKEMAKNDLNAMALPRS